VFTPPSSPLASPASSPEPVLKDALTSPLLEGVNAMPPSLFLAKPIGAVAGGSMRRMAAVNMQRKKLFDGQPILSVTVC